MLTFAIVLATVCVPVTPSGFWFFDDSTAVVYGRWNGDMMFVAERVIRGEAKVHETFVAETGPCAYPRTAELYLVSRNCRDGKCRVTWAELQHAPRLLKYLEARHFETHETVLAKALRWYAEQISDEEFDAWLSTVAHRHRGEQDDQFLDELIVELRWLLEELRPITRRHVRSELETFAKMARSFPRGTANEFDARVEASGNDDAPYRDDYEGDLLDAIKKIRERATALGAERATNGRR